MTTAADKRFSTMTRSGRLSFTQSSSDSDRKLPFAVNSRLTSLQARRDVFNTRNVCPKFATLFLLCVSLSYLPSITNAQEEGFKPLFDGKTLEGWEGKKEWFRVEDQAIVAGSLEREIPNNEFLCTTERYENFELRLKAKLTGKGENAGIQFRSERIPMHHEVIGYQCDMGVGQGRPIWGSLYDESRRKKFLDEGDSGDVSESLRYGDWNDLRIRCVDNHIKIWLNDVLTVDYKESDADIATNGIIGLQIHSGPPAEAWYKEIRIKPLESNK